MKPFVTVTIDESKCCEDNPNGIVIASNIQPGPLAVINMLAAGISQMAILAAQASSVVMADGTPAKINNHPSNN